MTNYTVSKTAKSLKSQRKRWERNVTKAHDNGLYALLGDCLDFYNDLDGNPELTEELKVHLEAQGINGNKGTSLSTLIVRAVFGKDKDKRTFSYAKTLTLAARDKPADVSMHKFIVSLGGIEAIRRGIGSAKKAAEARAANLSKAKKYFSTAAALGSTITLADEDRNVNEGRLFLAIMREETDGNYSMVYETTKDSLLNSAFTDARTTIPDDVDYDVEEYESDQSDATKTTVARDEATPAADANITDGEASTDSLIEPDLVYSEMDAEPQSDTKTDEVGPELATENGNRRAVTMQVELPSVIRERLAALAA